MMSFGRSIPAEMQGKWSITWGARAIFTCNQYTRYKGHIDLLGDRQNLDAADEIPSAADEKEFVTWLNKKGLPAMRKQCASLDTNSDEVETFDDGLFHIEASPQRSYGYLYIRAWKSKTEGNLTK